MSKHAAAFHLATTTLADAVFDSLRQRIASGEVRPSERVTEGRIVDEYNVARPTAKACIERLVGIGLLERDTHKAATVPALTVDDIDDLFLARATIELTAARIVAESGEVSPVMIQAQQALDVAGKLDDRAALIRADIDFHSGLVRSSRSKRLVRMHDIISGEIFLTIGHAGHHQSSIAAVAAEHALILEYLSARDAENAVARLKEHLDSAHTRVRNAYAR